MPCISLRKQAVIEGVIQAILNAAGFLVGWMDFFFLFFFFLRWGKLSSQRETNTYFSSHLLQQV